MSGRTESMRRFLWSVRSCRRLCSSRALEPTVYTPRLRQRPHHRERPLLAATSRRSSTACDARPWRPAASLRYSAPATRRSSRYAGAPPTNRRPRSRWRHRGAARHGIGDTTVCPGPVDTPLLDERSNTPGLDVRRYLIAAGGRPMAADVLAEQVVAAVRTNRALVLPGRAALLSRGARFAPRLTKRIIEAGMRRELRHASR